MAYFWKYSSQVTTTKTSDMIEKKDESIMVDVRLTIGSMLLVALLSFMLGSL